MMETPRANVAAEAKSADVHEAVIAELVRRIKPDNARKMDQAEMPAWRAADRG